MPYALLLDEPVGHALSRIATEQTDKAIEALSALDSKAAVHEARKSCKRLRALLRLFRTGLGSGYRAADSEVRDIARLLSMSRDQDVLLSTCEKLLRECSSEETRDALEMVRGALVAATDNRAQAPFDEVIERLQSLRDKTKKWRAKRPRRSAADGIKQAYRNGRRRRRNCDIDGPATPWHQWRKSVKHHGYHAELLERLHPVCKAYAKPWDRLGKLLGKEHDLSILGERLAEVTLPDERLAALALQETRRQRAALREKAADVGKRLYRPSPRMLRKVVRDLLPD